jgi:hypothetical protein
VEFYKILFQIFNNNLEDVFIKINIIDIVAKVYSKIQHSEVINVDICKCLYDIVKNDNNVEVISHVLNAYFDIYSEDNFNKILLDSGIVEMMKIGYTQFRTKVRVRLIFRYKLLLRPMRLIVRLIRMPRKRLRI